MPFVKGQSGNPLGRSKGQKNKSSEITKQLISELLRSEADKLPELMNELTAKERIDAFTKLAAYVMPRPLPDNEASTISFQKIKIIPNFLSIDE